ncbi:MAG TPA: D-alanyl-D-alanine carboxypeptidase/D-alanyl-D-alanine-endopeptidase, partial [Pyrinomonadaceae bacterium]|nr:D-alanyl-D-alanine carboxypeptidase/D-alanyl-D-alanine-endopeptidase [Pyrinomonadaceae bacterium]
MKKYLSALLAGCFLTAFAFSASRLAAQQQPQRERRVSPAASAPTPSPTPLSSPVPGGLALVSSRSSVETLQKAISSLLTSRGLDDAMVAIKVQSLSTGQVLFEQNAQKLMRPASNMKVYTVAAALDRLGPDYRFKTSVYAAARPSADGTINGDLIIYGRGDPTFSFRFNNGDYYKRINDLADRVVAAGVKRITGDLIGDESFFTGAPYGSGWEWEDLQWWYGAEVSALSVNDNFVNLSIKPGAVGSSAVVAVQPGDPLLIIKNRMITGARGTRRDLSVYRELGSSVVEVSGS